MEHRHNQQSEHDWHHHEGQQSNAYQGAFSGWNTDAYAYGYGQSYEYPGWNAQYTQRAPWPSEMQYPQGNAEHYQQQGSYYHGQGYQYPTHPNVSQPYVPPSSLSTYKNSGDPSSHPPRQAFNQRTKQSPPPQPPPRSPSPTYLTKAEQPSSKLDSPEDLRKLLILDLNGSLLIRAAHRPASERKKIRDRGQTKGDAQEVGAAPSPSHHHNTTEQGGSSRPDPGLRAVHPRPYMPTFRAYLFAPETRRWLDVMVWSSAQPHSVADMAKHCFGEEKERLVAIWARDTLGLSKADYRTSSNKLSS
jgi:hypothetical protein